VFLLSVLVARVAGAVEIVYGRSLGPALTWGLSRLTGFLPFSLADVLIVGFVAVRGVAAVRGLAAVVRRTRRFRNAFFAGLLRIAADVGIIVALFYGLWGFQYSRPSVEERLGWPPGTEATIGTITDLAVDMIEATNEAYRDLHGTDDAGSPTQLANRGALDPALESGWQRAAFDLGVAGPAAGRFGAAKRPLISPLLDWLGISGFYFPFTGEANVNRGIPAVSYPQVAAHEKSHQRGIGPENEANFFGFLAASRAPDPHSRYSAYLFAQRQLLFAMIRSDPIRVPGLVERRLPGVQRDVDDLIEYWARHRGPARRVSRALNDAYLRTNRVEGGVASYGRSVELLIAYSRTRGGTLR
jgi:hypothetical protein